jgi:hypothetical protein
MNSNKNLIQTIGLLIALVFVVGIYVAITPQTPKNAHCVTIYVDEGTLASTQPTTRCIPVSGRVSGPAFLTRAGYDIVGTKKYPTQIICRLNGAPASDPCITMPPADSYWAILIEQNNKWTWAQTGIDQATLKNGQGIGLVYAHHGKVTFPK